MTVSVSGVWRWKAERLCLDNEDDENEEEELATVFSETGAAVAEEADTGGGRLGGVGGDWMVRFRCARVGCIGPTNRAMLKGMQEDEDCMEEGD